MGLVKSSHPPFSFTIEQYDGLLAASLSATIVSVLASLAGLLVHFLLLWYDHHRPDNENYSMHFENLKDTLQHDHINSHDTTHSQSKKSSSGAMNRVSLRLIVLACISYNIYSVAQLVVTGITEKVLACRVLAYFIVCFDVAGSMFLGLVGLNLVLVFVINVKHPERFEKYYYAITALISIFVFVPPLVLKAGRTIDKNDSCWYHFFFEGRKANPFNWLYYYSWLLFASILATVSSIIAIRKVILEKNNFAHTINREETSRPGMNMASSSAHFQRNPQAYAEKNSDLFRRVAIRCICYALVPILCKSWGIGIEIAITSGIVVNYPILVIDRFMACIMGFFVSCIYFSDPSVRMVWHDMMIDYKKRYVDQLYYVDITKVIITPSQRTMYTIMNFSIATHKKAKSDAVPDPVYIDDAALRRPTTKKRCAILKPARWIPMRRIDISQNKPIMNPTSRDYTQTRLFEPYAHPTLARCLYWFFVHLLFYRPAYQKRNEKGKSSSTISAKVVSTNETDSDDQHQDETSSSHRESSEETTPPPPSPVDDHPPSTDILLEKPSRPLLRAGSRNRPVSSSLIKSHQEKATQMKKEMYQGEVISGRSSSYPLSAEASHSFLDQKVPPPHESRHLPTIGHLIQSVSPVHSFMAVRKAAAISALPPRPSSFISGSSSPVASISSVSSASSLKLETQTDELDHDNALTARCIHTYHQANLGDQVPGLSPPSKQHYTFIYRQGERIPPPQEPVVIQKKRIPFPDSEKEMLSSGVRTLLLHIKNDATDQNERIRLLVGHWQVDSSIYHS